MAGRGQWSASPTSQCWRPSLLRPASTATNATGLNGVAPSAERRGEAARARSAARGRGPCQTRAHQRRERWLRARGGPGLGMTRQREALPSVKTRAASLPAAGIPGSRSATKEREHSLGGPWHAQAKPSMPGLSATYSWGATQSSRRAGEGKEASGGFDAKVRVRPQASPTTSERCAGCAPDCVLDAERKRFVKLGCDSATPGGFICASDPASTPLRPGSRSSFFLACFLNDKQPDCRSTGASSCPVALQNRNRMWG